MANPLRFSGAVVQLALEAIGGVLRATLRRSDSAFRLGGDEFALILEDAGIPEASHVVDRIGAGIAGVEAGAGHLLRASFGVALGDGDAFWFLASLPFAPFAATTVGCGVAVAVGATGIASSTRTSAFVGGALSGDGPMPGTVRPGTGAAIFCRNAAKRFSASLRSSGLTSGNPAAMFRSNGGSRLKAPRPCVTV